MSPPLWDLIQMQHPTGAECLSFVNVNFVLGIMSNDNLCEASTIQNNPTHFSGGANTIPRTPD